MGTDSQEGQARLTWIHISWYEDSWIHTSVPTKFKSSRSVTLFCIIKILKRALCSLLAARQDWEGWDAINRDGERKRVLPFWRWSRIPGRQSGRRGMSVVLVLLQSHYLILRMLNDKGMILAKIGEFCGNYCLLRRLLWDHQKRWVLCLEIWAAGDKKISDFIGKPNKGVICGRGREEGDEESKDVILSFQSHLWFFFYF